MEINDIRDELYCKISEPTKWILWLYEDHGVERMCQIKDTTIDKVKAFDPWEYYLEIEKDIETIIESCSNQMQLDFKLVDFYEYSLNLYQESYKSIDRNSDAVAIMDNDVKVLLNEHLAEIGNYLNLTNERLSKVVSVNKIKKAKTSKPVKEFPELLKTEKQEELAAELKILIAEDSNKRNAILFAVLSQNYLLDITDRSRRKFYLAWFKYCGFEIPTNNNFSGINDFMEWSVNGLLFKEHDFDFMNLEPQILKIINKY